jgi:hypothetical protein
VAVAWCGWRQAGVVQHASAGKLAHTVLYMCLKMGDTHPSTVGEPSPQMLRLPAPGRGYPCVKMSCGMSIRAAAAWCSLTCRQAGKWVERCLQGLQTPGTLAAAVADDCEHLTITS